MKNLLLSIALLSVVGAKKSCEMIKVASCQHVGYNYTTLPNFAHHGTQSEAETALKTLEPLLRSGCSPYVHMFACAAYVPMCVSGQRVGPCRGLCEKTRADCASKLRNLGALWPKELDCKRFYHEGDYEHLCIMGPLL